MDSTRDDQTWGPVSVIAEQNTTAVVDCGFNFGQVGALRAIEIAIEKAKKYNVACVITRRCNHVGRLGYFTQLAAEASMFALGTINVPKYGHYVVPFGGRAGRLGTNSISYAVPGREYPIVADISVSTVSGGKVRIHHNRGTKLPGEWVIDAGGESEYRSRGLLWRSSRLDSAAGGRAGIQGVCPGITGRISQRDAGG